MAHSPIQKQQQGENWQIGGRHIGFLLEAHKNDYDQCCRDDVIALKHRRMCSEKKLILRTRIF